MPFLSVTAEEWRFAKTQLNQAANGIKIKHEKRPVPINLKHSFIKINNKIYCLAKNNSSDPVSHQGCLAKAKFAQDEEGNVYIIKIDRERVSPYYQKESEFLFDLSIGVGTAVRADKKRQYTVLKYLGRNLEQILEDKAVTLSDEQRIDIAIKFTYQVYRLHQGLSSLSKTAYAHHDIKLDNVTVDDQGNVHLIDFGFSTKEPYEISDVKTAAGRYTAYTGIISLTGAELDTVALKRSLFAPAEFYSSRGHIRLKDYKPEPSLIPERLLHAHNLGEFIDTFSAYGDFPDYTKQVMNPLAICAALINAKEKLGISNSQLRQNHLLCENIVNVYFSKSGNKLKDIIGAPNSAKLIAILLINNALDKFASLKHDNQLIDLINQTDDKSTQAILLKLKELNLLQYGYLIINSAPSAQLIAQFIQQNKNELIEPYLKHHSANLTHVLLSATQRGLVDRCGEIINNSELLLAVSSLPKHYEFAKLIDVMTIPEITVQQISSFCLNSDKLKAIDIILNKRFYNINNPTAIEKKNIVNNILKDPDLHSIIINFSNRGVHELLLYKMLTESDMRQAAKAAGNQNANWLKTLFCNHLLSIEHYLLLRRYPSLRAQVMRLIDAGYASLITAHTLPENIGTVEEFMLRIAKKNIQALEFANDELKSDFSFLTQAAKINHRAFAYASDSVKNNVAFMQRMEKYVLHYEFINENASRYHFFSAGFSKQHLLSEEFDNKKGDALKTAILKKFKYSLEGADDSKINSIVETFKKGDEYKLLCTAQGITATMFRLQTSSSKAVDMIIDDAKLANRSYSV